MGNRIIRPFLSILAVACLALPAGEEKHADAKPEQKAPVKEETLTVSRGDLQPVLEAEGTLDPVTKKVLRLVPQEFPGPFVVLDAALTGRKVEAGDVIARFDPAVLDHIIRGASEGLEAIKKKYESLHEEYETLKTGNRQKLERLGIDLANAERDQKNFEKYGEEQLLKQKALAVTNQEFQSAEREDELAQLEKMYKGTQLATDTKEIVLERARRSVAINRQALDLTRKSEKQTIEFEHPSRKEQLALAVEQKKQDLELQRTVMRLAELQKSEDLAAQQHLLRDNQERLARLESDTQQMTLKAPIAGIVINRGIDTGDKANVNVPLMDVWDLNNYQVRFSGTAGEIATISAGENAKVRLRDFPGLELSAKIDEISSIPLPEGPDKIVRFAVRATLAESKVLRPGLKARVELAREELKNVLSIPRTAVIYKDERTWCKVRQGEKLDTREVVLGAWNRERVVVEKGLNEGEVVVVKEGQK